MFKIMVDLGQPFCYTFSITF
ncbi:hypothetical protein ACQ27_gp147 [Klebsiella phage K64-1]|nr:hypothetical protein ACQ27_gp147 [Klebsiella phage K64-1]